MGPMWLGATAKGLFYLNLGPLDDGALRSFFTGRHDVGFREGGETVERAAREIAHYFARKQRKFTVPLDLTGTSAFAKKVWRAAARIPFGETRSYAWIADRAGGPNFARAVGGALGSNPVPLIIPCHRVVAAGGGLGGFTGGLRLKTWLLEFEAGSQVLPLAEP